MRENKMTRFVFLIEEARRAEAENDTRNDVPQHEEEERGAEENKQPNKKSYMC